MEINKTISYYNENAERFVQGTVHVCFSEMQEMFLGRLPGGAHILDFGCGSGRDTKYFLDRGCLVDATDGSASMCELAGRYTGITVKNQRFQELEEDGRYDGIWACSSILHVPLQELPDILQRMEKALKENGIIYASFKYGDFSGIRNGRYFTDMTEDTFAELMYGIKGLKTEQQWVTSDVRLERGEEKWLNLILRKIQGLTN